MDHYITVRKDNQGRWEIVEVLPSDLTVRHSGPRTENYGRRTSAIHGAMVIARELGVGFRVAFHRDQV